MTQPHLSVIVPTYNVRPFIRLALDSLARQTCENFEVVIVNDGSTDGSDEIAKEFARQDPRFRVIDQPNGGYGKAVNAGLNAASGEYIGILEPDDIATDRMFETLLDAAQKTGASIVRGDFALFQSTPEFNASDVVPTNQFKRLLNDQVEGWVEIKQYPEALCLAPAIWSSIYKASFLRENKISVLETPGASYQDFPFFVESLFCAERFYAVDRVLLYYRDSHPTSSSAKGGNKGLVVFDLYDHLRRSLQAMNPDRYGDMEDIINYIFFMHHYFHYKRLHPKYRNQFLNQLREKFKNIPTPKLLSGKNKLDYISLKYGGAPAYKVAITLSAFVKKFIS